MYTSPVNQSAGPLAVSIELRVICIKCLSFLVDGCFRRRRPGREQLKPFRRGGAGFGGVDEQHETRLGGDGQLLVGESELTDDGAAETLGPGPSLSESRRGETTRLP